MRTILLAAAAAFAFAPRAASFFISSAAAILAARLTFTRRAVPTFPRRTSTAPVLARRLAFAWRAGLLLLCRARRFARSGRRRWGGLGRFGLGDRLADLFLQGVLIGFCHEMPRY